MTSTLSDRSDGDVGFVVLSGPSFAFRVCAPARCVAPTWRTDDKQGWRGENKREGDSSGVEREMLWFVMEQLEGVFETLCSKPRPSQLLYTQLSSVSLVSAPLGERLDNQNPGTVCYSTV